MKKVIKETPKEDVVELKDVDARNKIYIAVDGEYNYKLVSCNTKDYYFASMNDCYYHLSRYFATPEEAIKAHFFRKIK